MPGRTLHAMSTTSETKAFTCSRSCGRGPGSPDVTTEAKYGAWGWFALLYGISALPKSVSYVCEECGETKATTRDPEVLRAHR